MSNNQRLELTWIGKDARPYPEARILLEETERSYHAKQRMAQGNLFDNRLVFGDNLLALKALEQEFSGRIKCAFLDPPYNTGSAFEHYDDGVEHSLWLSLMRDRLAIYKSLLHLDGTIWIAIDDSEGHYLKVLCDEVFGRKNFVANVVWRSSDAANNDAKTFSLDHNHILVYARNPEWVSKPLPRTDEANAHYRNPDNDPNGAWFAGNLSSPKPRPNLRYSVPSPSGISIEPPANGWRWKRETLLGMIETGEIVFSPDGTRLIKKTYLNKQGGLAPSTLWDDIEETGHNRQAKYELKKLFPEVPTAELFSTPKPERLIRKILAISTEPNDWVLDSFAGSGTTGAVAHKMGRRWIMVERGEHCHTHIIPRLKKVIDGEDLGGITQEVAWKGGGGFRYSRLAPSLLKQDRWGNWVISEGYNPAMLAEAVCKLLNFTYSPSEEHYWIHGRSSERDFLYVTTQSLTSDQLRAISEDVGDERSLLICCRAFRARPEEFPNLSIKKIPHAVMRKCEWGKDDYSLKVSNLPSAPAIKEAEEASMKPSGNTKDVSANQPDLFAGGPKK